MANKVNNYEIRIVKMSGDEYEITLYNREENKGRTFRYRTALGHSAVQEIFYDLTNAQCADIIEGWV